MPKKSNWISRHFDDQLLNGLDFCRKAYNLFAQVRNQPDGIEKLRLRPTKIEKRLVEELIPLARYVQARYREGRCIKVHWLSGSQPYDAILWSSGTLVEQRWTPKKLFVEVTTSVHQNEHLARRLFHERGGSFRVKGISQDKKTGNIVSKPHVHAGRRTRNGSSRPDTRTAHEQEQQSLSVGDGVGRQLRFEQPYS